MNIIESAKQAGPLITTPFDQWCENFAALVRAQALEEAAGVCENTLAHHYMKQVIPTHDEALLLAACADCAAAIRKLKDKA